MIRFHGCIVPALIAAVSVPAAGWAEGTVYLERLGTIDGLFGRQVEARGTSVFVLEGYAGYYSGLHAIDASDPRNPRIVDTYMPENAVTVLDARRDGLWSHNGMDLWDSRLYLTVSDGKTFNGFDILDARDPAELSKIGEYREADENARGGMLTVNGDRALFWLSSPDRKSTRLRTVRLAGPSGPEAAGELRLPFAVHKVYWERDERALVKAGREADGADAPAFFIAAVSVEDFAAPEVEYEIPLGEYSHVGVAGDWIYASKPAPNYYGDERSMRIIHAPPDGAPVATTAEGIEFRGREFRRWGDVWFGWVGGRSDMGFFELEPGGVPVSLGEHRYSYHPMEGAFRYGYQVSAFDIAGDYLYMLGWFYDEAFIVYEKRQSGPPARVGGYALH